MNNDDLKEAHPQSGSSSNLELLIFLGEGNTRMPFPEKNLLEQMREPTLITLSFSSVNFISPDFPLR